MDNATPSGGVSLHGDENRTTPSTPTNRRLTRRSLRLSQISNNSVASTSRTKNMSPLKKQQPTLRQNHLLQNLAPTLLPPTPAKTSSPRVTRRRSSQQDASEQERVHLTPPRAQRKARRAWERTLSTTTTGKKVWKRTSGSKDKQATMSQSIGSRIDEGSVRAVKRLRGSQGSYLETQWEVQFGTKAETGEDGEVIMRKEKSTPRRRKRAQKDIILEAVVTDEDVQPAEVDAPESMEVEQAVFEQSQDDEPSNAIAKQFEPTPTETIDSHNAVNESLTADAQEETPIELEASASEASENVMEAAISAETFEVPATGVSPQETSAEPLDFEDERTPDEKIPEMVQDSEEVEHQPMKEADDEPIVETSEEAATESEAIEQPKTEVKEKMLAQAEELEENSGSESELSDESDFEAEEDEVLEDPTEDVKFDDDEDSDKENQVLESEDEDMDSEEAPVEGLSPISLSFQSIMSVPDAEEVEPVEAELEPQSSSEAQSSDENNETSLAAARPLVFSKYGSFVSDDDTALLNSFLSLSKAKKAEREAQSSPQKMAIFRAGGSPTKSPRAVLGELNEHAPSPIKFQASPVRPSAPLAPLEDETVDIEEALFAVADEEAIEDEDTAPIRRSTRTRLTKPTANINVRRPNGTEFVFLQRTEEQERMLATKRNTKKNRGDALLACDYLVWMKEQGDPTLPASPSPADQAFKGGKRKGRKVKMIDSDKLAGTGSSSPEGQQLQSFESSENSSQGSNASSGRPKKSVQWREQLEHFFDETEKSDPDLENAQAVPATATIAGNRSTRIATPGRKIKTPVSIAASMKGTPVAKKTKGILISAAPATQQQEAAEEAAPAQAVSTSTTSTVAAPSLPKPIVASKATVSTTTITTATTTATTSATTTTIESNIPIPRSLKKKTSTTSLLPTATTAKKSLSFNESLLELAEKEKKGAAVAVKKAMPTMMTPAKIRTPVIRGRAAAGGGLAAKRRGVGA